MGAADAINAEIPVIFAGGIAVKFTKTALDFGHKPKRINHKTKRVKSKNKLRK